MLSSFISLFPNPLAGVGLARLAAASELDRLTISGMVHLRQASATLANFKFSRRTKVDARAALLDLAIGQVEGAGARRADDAAVALPLLFGGAAAFLDAKAGAGLARRYLEAVGGAFGLALPLEFGLCDEKRVGMNMMT